MKSKKLDHLKMSLLFCLPLFLVLGLAVSGGCMEIPTIEKLTGGKVKTGDTITKENVDLVKEWLAPSTYEEVKRGMVLIIAPMTPPEMAFPAPFLEATTKNEGKAVMGKNDVVYTKDGRKWVGGFPFPNPRTGIEAMWNFKMGVGYGADDFDFYVRTDYVDSGGRSYKYNLSWYRKLIVNPRLMVPPIPSFPGHEEESYRAMIVYLAPFDLKGVGIVSTRYYDDIAQPDEGYLYAPALRRTRRMSATNWQDNIAGTDMTYGDVGSFAEPFNVWDFQLLGEKIMLLPGLLNPKSDLLPGGDYKHGVKLDVGAKFPRLYWEVRPVVVVEAKPKTRHVYGKQIMYLDKLLWRGSVIDRYDRQMKLWKTWVIGSSQFKDKRGYIFTANVYPHQYDFQIDHMTRLTTLVPTFNAGSGLEDYTVRKLLELGK